MQGAVTYPLLQRPSLSAQRGGILTYIRGASFAFWMFTLQWPFWWIKDWTSWQEELDFKSYYYIGFGVCFVVHLTLGLDQWLRAPFGVVSTWSGTLATLFCAIALITSPLSSLPGVSAKYAAATWVVYILLYLYWRADYRIIQRMIVLAGLVIFVWQLILAINLGVQWGYGIGGILRNYTGQAGFASMVCCLMSSKKSLRASAIAAAFGLALFVNSRGTLVALVVFFSAYYAVYFGSIRFIAYALGSLLAVCCAMLVWPDLWDLVANRVMAMNVAGRGIGSGFTGRWETFVNGIATFWKRPLLGYGFRAAVESRVNSSHSGLIRLFVETGFVGAFTMLGAIFVEMVRRFQVAQQFRNLQPSAVPGIDVAETMRVNVITFATLCTTLTFWVYEPLYTNLGSVSSLVFWLFMVAPVYVTSQGVSVHR